MMNIGGPLTQLQWFGLICPCFEKDEDRNARQALKNVNGRSITWFTGANKTSSSFSLGGLFGSNKEQQDNKEALAVFKIQHNEDGEPHIFVDPHSSASVGYKLDIRLRRVDRVQSDPQSGHISLWAKPPTDKKQSPKELVQFLVLQDTTDLPLVDDERNLFVHHLSVLVEWERQRCQTLGYHDDDDDDDQPNFLRARAQKAAHFAQRELELQQTKREREKRKAKLVQDSGGLKYTALAMASRGEQA